MGSVSVLNYVQIVSVFAAVVSSYEFQVGGHKGWTKPTPNQTHTYNHWATLKRFQVGDSLHFKYEKDSVLIVKATAYENCNISNPIATFEDGNTTFKIERDGLFYFISGHTQHCKAGQKMVIRVMVQPGSATSSYDNDSDYWDAINWGPPPLNSTLTSSVASYFLTALGGVVAILYLLM